jgi:deoxyguanosine kinase
MTYIEIVGVMGAGKTSLLKVFNECAQYTPILETEEQLNNLHFVEPYLREPEKYGFEGGVNFIAFHLNRIRESLHTLPPDAKVVVDTSLLVQYAYGKGCLSPEDLKLIGDLVERGTQKLPKPDLRIVVHLPIDTHVERLRQRGRESEKNVSREWLVDTQKAIDQAVKKFGKGVPTLYLDASKYDWVSNENDKQEVLRLAQEKMKEPPRKKKPGFGL